MEKEDQLENPLLPRDKPPEGNERLGLIAVCFTMAASIFSQSTVSYVFLKNPELTLWQLLSIRSGISSLISVGLLGGRVKEEMYDKISSEDFRKLLTRTLMFGCSIPITILAIKNFPVSVVRSASSLQPIWAAILAYYMIGEVATTRDILSISTSLVAVYLIMTP
jgi:drug/metabolite transporter (DMT)-like permease